MQRPAKPSTPVRFRPEPPLLGRSRLRRSADLTHQSRCCKSSCASRHIQRTSITASSLASYLLSQWTSIRNGGMSIGWVAISIGITLLLAASAIVVLALGLLPTLRLSPNIESAEQMRKSAQSGRETTGRVLARQEALTEALNATITATAPTDRGGSPAASRNFPEHRNGIEAASAVSSPQPPLAPWAAKSGAASHGVGLVFAEADPWAATSCVYVFNRDPADLTRWTIENECGAPVGVLFASCSKSPPECSDRQSTSWEYQSGGIILPGKAQRPVTDEEQTQYGSQIRYIACMAAASLTIELIGQSSESRSSPSWLEQFDVARNGDECLRRIQQWSDAGRASGKSIDVLLGANVPGKVRPGSTSEP